MKKRIYLSPPHMGGQELALVKEAFETNWVSPAGPHLDAFEKELCSYNRVPYCAALCSGTAAIHLALIILGVKQDDEVVCSSFTFAGSCNPIVYLGARPIFVDSESDSWNMDPDIMESCIVDRIRLGKKPKAIIVVHLYGMPARILEIMEIAKRFDIPVIEDAAEGLGSTFEGQKLGSFGDIGIYSFNGNKIITTSGGGAMVSEKQDWIQKAKYLSTQARDPAPHYEHSEIGYNYRLSNISAAIGRGQLQVLDDRVSQRRTIFQYYQEAFSHVNGIGYQRELTGSFSNRWLTTLIFDVGFGTDLPEKIRMKLESENIESRPLWKPMHLQPVFKNAPYYGSKVSEGLFQMGLCLPSGSSMTTSDLSRVAQIVLGEISS